MVPLFPDAPSSCTVLPFPVGANGIAFHRGELVVAGSQRSLLLKVPVRQDLPLGDLEVFAYLSGNPAFIGMRAPDGFDVDRRGNVFAALVNAASVIKVSPDGLQIDEVGTMDYGLTVPTSLAVQERRWMADRLFVTNLDLGIPGFPPAIPPVRIDL